MQRLQDYLDPMKWALVASITTVPLFFLLPGSENVNQTDAHQASITSALDGVLTLGTAEWLAVVEPVTWP